MTHRLVFLGNCQASALAVAFNNFVEPLVGYGSVHIDWRQMRGREAEIASAETVVYQVSDLDWRVPDFISPGTRVILFPYVSGGFLWPFAHEAHPHVSTTGMGKYGVFVEDGDAFLNRMIRSGTDPDAAVAAYLSLDLQRLRLDRRLELALDLQRRRDQIAGIDTASFIEAHLRDTELFLARGHLGDSLARHVAMQVMRRLDVPAEALARLERRSMVELYQPGEHPIHPWIAEHYGLSYSNPGRRFRTLHGLFTFEEFSRLYMRSEFNEVVFEAIRAAEKREPPQRVIPMLERALLLSPASVTARLALASQFYDLGDRSRCWALVRAAVKVDPANTRALSVLASEALEAHDADALEAVARQFLAHYPGHAHGLHLLNVVTAWRG